MNIQDLFDKKILEQEYLDPGYEDHATEVIRVKTEDEQVVFRSPRYMCELNELGSFGWGLYKMFNLDMRDVFRLEDINKTITKFGPIPSPQILSKGYIKERPYIIVQFMKGKFLSNLAEQPEELVEEFGKILATIHKNTFSYFGLYSGDKQYSLKSFWKRLGNTIEEIVGKYYSQDDAVKERMQVILYEISQLPDPTESAFVMIDLDSTQLLAQDGHFTSIVDTDAYVVAPRELDFVNIEYLLDERSVIPFIRGYSSILPIPDISKPREPLRYFLRLLEVQGEVNIEMWMNKTKLF